MNISTLFDRVNAHIDDIKFNSNEDRTDQLHTDEDRIGALNMAIEMFDFHSGGNRFSQEDSDYQINLVAGQDVYQLPEAILRIYDIYDGNRKLCEESFNSVKSDYQINNNPQVYYLDYKDGYIKFYPTPISDSQLKVRGSFETTYFTLSDLDLELPFPKKYQEYFKFGIAYFLYKKADNDSQDFELAEDAKREFLDFCKRVRLTNIRRSDTIVTYDNNPYNCW